jgi:transcriptional regulator with XRE-family HTH domain
VSESTEQNAIGSNLTGQLRQNFADEEYRNAYAESFLNSFVAAQIKVLREEYPMTQSELADAIGTKQPGIARLENVNYSAWKVETLRKVARALKVRLKITFEEWGTLPGEIEGFNREALVRAPFDRDPVFCPSHPPALGRAENIPPTRGPQIDLGTIAGSPSGAASQKQELLAEAS